MVAPTRSNHGCRPSSRRAAAPRRLVSLLEAPGWWPGRVRPWRPLLRMQSRLLAGALRELLNAVPQKTLFKLLLLLSHSGGCGACIQNAGAEPELTPLCHGPAAAALPPPAPLCTCSALAALRVRRMCGGSGEDGKLRTKAGIKVMAPAVQRAPQAPDAPGSVTRHSYPTLPLCHSLAPVEEEYDEEYTVMKLQVSKEGASQGPASTCLHTGLMGSYPHLYSTALP